MSGKPVSEGNLIKKQNTLYVGSLAKGLQILRCFDESATELSLAQITQRTGLEKSATQRLTNTLHLEGMLDKDAATKRYRPSHAWLEMAYAYSWSNPLVRLAMPKLIELSHRLDATVNLAELSGESVLYVSRVPGKSSHFAATILGRRLPALSSAAGQAILSTMPELVRAQIVETWQLAKVTEHTITDRSAVLRSLETAAVLGYAQTEDQLTMNQKGIAAPIKRPDGTALAALQISLSSHLWSDERIKAEILPHLVEAADGIAPPSKPSVFER